MKKMDKLEIVFSLVVPVTVIILTLLLEYCTTVVTGTVLKYVA